MVTKMLRAMSGWFKFLARGKVRAISRAVDNCINSMPDSTPAELRAQLRRVVITLHREETYIAVSGLFKAGKSTLINRLTHWDILPSSNLPETGAPTILKRRKPMAVRAMRHDGSIKIIEANPDSIATETSLYMADGHRRALDELAKSIEIDVPELKLGSHCALIDLPGLRDSNALDEVALQTAMEADLLVWVFRSEPAFSEQDGAFLASLVAMCGAQVIQLVLNIMSTASDMDSWEVFQRKGLLAHKTALEQHVHNSGLEQRHIDDLIVVDALKLRQGWFGETFGGRKLHALLRATSRKSFPEVQIGRLARVAAAVDAYASWLNPYLTESERIFEGDNLRYATYKEGEQRRALLRKQASDTVDSAFKGLTKEISKAADDAVSRVTSTGFEADRDVATPVINGIVSIVEARVDQLIATLTAIAVNPEVEALSSKNVNTIVNGFALNNSSLKMRRKDAIAIAIAEEIGEVRTAKPRVSFGRCLSWLVGSDSEVERVISEARHTLRSRAKALTEKYTDRKPAIQAIVAGSLVFRPLQSMPKPNPIQLEQLKKSMQKVSMARELLKNSGRPK